MYRYSSTSSSLTCGCLLWTCCCRYHIFRSAFEILETIGDPPVDVIQENVDSPGGYRRPKTVQRQVLDLQEEVAAMAASNEKLRRQLHAQAATLRSVLAVLKSNGFDLSGVVEIKDAEGDESS